MPNLFFREGGTGGGGGEVGFFLRRSPVYWNCISGEACNEMWPFIFKALPNFSIGIPNIAGAYHFVKQPLATGNKVKGYQTIVWYKLTHSGLPYLHIYYIHNRVDRYRFFFPLS